MKLSMKLIAAPVATALVVLSASQIQSWLSIESTQKRLTSQAESHQLEGEISSCMTACMRSTRTCIGR